MSGSGDDFPAGLYGSNRHFRDSTSMLHVYYVWRREILKSASESNQNLTVRLGRSTLRKAKILAAKQNTSISRLVARYIETLVGEDDAYEHAQRRALALLDDGFSLGGRVAASRDEWHDRQKLR
jgi:hypothetical protein